MLVYMYICIAIQFAYAALTHALRELTPQTLLDVWDGALLTQRLRALTRTYATAGLGSENVDLLTRTLRVAYATLTPPVFSINIVQQQVHVLHKLQTRGYGPRAIYIYIYICIYMYIYIYVHI